MKTVINTNRCLGYFETANQEEIYEICTYNVTNSELILEAMTV
ncbi:MAG: hypothetical protein ABJO28_17455 [Maribacter dokdonensis]|uniref:Uncharacterized protein n=1 Tax=Maribacter dokdonensis TaxID=320912 RepID=A0A1H4MMD2_9FLAO|nr:MULTISPECIES: hypothetical protein [Maribacter]KSA15137.1 hypothetical protein I600_1748 [Maribacter dokdonensis DSW-8]MDP2525707.1 hypothetical protein [Maribacter dokdonensis]CAG2534411.1 hypothetical protein MAR621_00654 [Maribacter dokdonensis]SDT16709.1 hypothetical protein SAMN05192545_2925 [Maribacter dokdonensis]SEB83675.1 hypothetical protein SAMN05192540_1675 [Maribacter dokdonensis]